MRTIEFPKFSGIRCLMMPYIQGEPDSLPKIYAPYRDIVSSTFLRKGDVGFLTIDESMAIAGKPHRGARARYSRALHTEAGILRGVHQWGGETTYQWGSDNNDDSETTYQWGGGPTWGGSPNVKLDRDVRILIASNVEDTCAVWDAEHEDTSTDGDIGHLADQYPYSNAIFLKKGEVREIGILTPHESLPMKHDTPRQFLRILSSGVHGREEYFTENPLVATA